LEGKSETIRGAFDEVLPFAALQEFKLLPQIARAQPHVDIDALKKAASVEEALAVVNKAVSA
jgi:hypothetical protein